MTQDRRQYPRLIPDAALLVSLGRSKRGFLSDLSEGGMAFDGLVAESSPNVISLAFDLPEGGGLIEAVAEVVWTCESRHRTGVRFLELAEASRQKLREWLSARVVALRSDGQEGAAHWGSVGGITGAARKWILQEISDEEKPGQISDGAAKAQEPGGTTASTGRRRTYRVSGMVLSLAVVCSAFVTLGYYLPGMVSAAKVNGHAGTSESPAGFSSSGPISGVHQISRTTPADQAKLPAANEGFILQVAAMAHKENADALVEKLHRQSFPAFVFDRSGDGFYRVDIGPYPDADYAHRVRDELRNAGFRTVLERQLPH